MTKLVYVLALASILFVADENLYAQQGTTPDNSSPPDASKTTPAPRQDLEQRVDALEKRLSGLGQELTGLKTNDLPQLVQQVGTSRNNITQLGQSVRSNGTEVANLIGLVQANEAAITSLGQSVESNGVQVKTLIGLVQANDTAIRDLAIQVADNNSKLGQIVKQNGRGEYYLNYNMQIPEAHRELRQAVSRAGTNQIRLWIYNPGPFDRIIYVNGTQWRAILGKSYVWVPFGNVAVSDITNVTPPTRTAGEQNWNPTAGEYEMHYDLANPWR